MPGHEERLQDGEEKKENKDEHSQRPRKWIYQQGFQGVFKTQNIKQVLSSAGTPHSNGMVKKAEDIIGRLISKLTLADPSFDWAKPMNKITDAINNTPNKTAREIGLDLKPPSTR